MYKGDDSIDGGCGKGVPIPEKKFMSVHVYRNGLISAIHGLHKINSLAIYYAGIYIRISRAR